MKINEAKYYDKTGIVMVSNGKFRLLSFQEGSRKVYHVSYGDDLNMIGAPAIVGWIQHISANTFLP